MLNLYNKKSGTKGNLKWAKLYENRLDISSQYNTD